MADQLPSNPLIERLVGAAVYVLAIAAMCGLLLGIVGFLGGNWEASGVGFLAAAVAAGSLLNAALRR